MKTRNLFLLFGAMCLAISMMIGCEKPDESSSSSGNQTLQRRGNSRGNNQVAAISTPIYFSEDTAIPSNLCGGPATTVLQIDSCDNAFVLTQPATSNPVLCLFNVYANYPIRQSTSDPRQVDSTQYGIKHNGTVKIIFTQKFCSTVGIIYPLTLVDSLKQLAGMPPNVQVTMTVTHYTNNGTASNTVETAPFNL